MTKNYYHDDWAQNASDRNEDVRGSEYCVIRELGSDIERLIGLYVDLKEENEKEKKELLEELKVVIDDLIDDTDSLLSKAQEYEECIKGIRYGLDHIDNAVNCSSF